MNNTRKRGSMNPWTHGIYLLCLCHTQLSCQTSLPNTNYKKQLLPISTQWALNQVQGHAEYRTWCRYTSHAFMKSPLSVVRLKKKKKKEIQRSKFKGLIDFNDLRIGQHSAFADRQELQGAIQNGRLLWLEGLFLAEVVVDFSSQGDAAVVQMDLYIKKRMEKNSFVWAANNYNFSKKIKH